MANWRLLFLLWLVSIVLPVCTAAQSRPLQTLALPPGFSIEVYSDSVPNARQLALGANGTVFAGSRRAGSVYAVVDGDGDGRAETVHTLARNLNLPSGIAFRDGALYVGEVHRVLRFDAIEAHLSNPPAPVVVYDALPGARHHGWKFLGFGPDGKLYIPVGAPCNVCEPGKPIFGTINRMNPDGSGFENFARGVRNSVGFDWHPETGALWFTDNGRDWMGDDLPDDELNRAPKPGLHFGFPYCHGANTSDPDFGGRGKCSDFTAPALGLGAHMAPLGMRFYTGKQFPEKYHNRIFMAQHGSWNRSTPVGYRVVTVQVEDGRVSGYNVFIEGWLRGAQAWGRPADVLVMPDGALLISDDVAGVIYRVSYRR